MCEVEICSHHKASDRKRFHDPADKCLRLHAHHLVRKRAGNQIIDPRLFKDVSLFLIYGKLLCLCIVHALARRYIKGKHDGLKSVLFFLFLDLMHQKLMTAVQPVELAEGDHTLLPHMKIQGIMNVLHRLFHKNLDWFIVILFVLICVNADKSVRITVQAYR